MTPSTHRDRALGCILAAAAGDALGAGYEFEPGWSGDPEPAMIGGGIGHFAPGEWTDDTTMAWCILDVAAGGLDLSSEAGLDALALRFRAWFDSHPRDIGVQTRHVLKAAGPEPTAEALRQAARQAHERTGRTAGNGSLMRTNPVAVAFLHDEDAMVEAVRQISLLTHFDPLNAEACVLWCSAQRHAMLHAELDVRIGLPHLPVDRRDVWARWLDEAETESPAAFQATNGFVVTALQAAWSAILHTAVPGEHPSSHLPEAIKNAVRIGNDTDTVACIAGQLLGARWGASAIPASWLDALHGYPGITGHDLAALTERLL